MPIVIKFAVTNFAEIHDTLEFLSRKNYGTYSARTALCAGCATTPHIQGNIRVPLWQASSGLRDQS